MAIVDCVQLPADGKEYTAGRVGSIWRQEYTRTGEKQSPNFFLDFRTASFHAQNISAKLLKSQHFVIVGQIMNFQHFKKINKKK